MHQPAIRNVLDVVKDTSTMSCRLKDGRTVPARAQGYHSFFNRVKAAFLVFTGRADALVWPGQ